MDQEYSRVTPTGETVVITRNETDDLYTVSINLKNLNPNFQLPSLNKAPIGETELIPENDLIEYLKSVNLLDIFLDIFGKSLENSSSQDRSTKADILMKSTTSSDLVTFTAKQKQALEFFLQRVLVPSSDTSLDLIEIFQQFKRQYPTEVLNLKIPIDENGSTALHWLCSLASSHLIKEIVDYRDNKNIENKVSVELDITLGDSLGESALVKAVKSVNNYDNGTFEGLLEVLYPSLNLLDNQKKTILHHIVIQSGKQGCLVAAKYYLDILMGWVVRPGGIKIDDSPVTLQWFILNILNAQDLEGDTCLNIASRLGNMAIVDLLLDYGADPSIANNSGLKPLDFGTGANQSGNSATVTGSSHMGENGNLSTNKRTNSSGAQSNASSSGESIKRESDENSGNNVSYSLPDNAPMMDLMQGLMDSINQKYKEELTSFNEEMNGLQKTIQEKRFELNDLREKIAKYKNLKDQYSNIQEQINSLKSGVYDQKKLFAVLSQDFPELLDQRMDSKVSDGQSNSNGQENYDSNTQELQSTQEDDPETMAQFQNGNSNFNNNTNNHNYDNRQNVMESDEELEDDDVMFDADEPFKIDAVYDFLKKKLEEEYDGDVERMEQDINVESLVNYFLAHDSSEQNIYLQDMPDLEELQFRLRMYEENEVGLEELHQVVKHEQQTLENKFKRVLSLCLKIDESKVDDMLDGLLEAISNEDLEDLGIDEVQSFLKHNGNSLAT